MRYQKCASVESTISTPAIPEVVYSSREIHARAVLCGPNDGTGSSGRYRLCKGRSECYVVYNMRHDRETIAMEDKIISRLGIEGRPKSLVLLGTVTSDAPES